MDQELLELLKPVLAGFVTLLLAANGWFIRNLISKLDNIGKVVSESLPEFKAQQQLLSSQISELKINIQDMNHELKEISSIRERLAVLETKAAKGGRREKLERDT